MLRGARDQRLDRGAMCRNDMGVAAGLLDAAATSWQASALRLEIMTFAPSLASSSSKSGRCRGWSR
jgi:hypothetical protein